jgi:RNA polymerase sigma factor (sigma-70 family)
MIPDHDKDLELPNLIENLMLRHREKWLRFAQRVVRDRADAEDVLQEAVLKMLMRNRSFCSRDQARMYLGRIISNTAIEIYHMRRRQRRRHCPLHEHLLAASCHSEPEWSLWEMEGWWTRGRMLELLGKGLASLPPKQYEAVRMTVLDPGLASIRDAGAEHDIPYSTLRHRSLQGLKQLRRYLHRALRTPALIAATGSDSLI